MQYSIRTDSGRNSGNCKMKTMNGYKNLYKKETNIDLVNQLATRLQDIKDQEGAPQVGMPTCSIDQAEAVRRYYAAFPALKKGEESPRQYYLPPPLWCHKTAPAHKMQSEPLIAKDWNSKKKYSSGKERRNSHGHKKNRRRNRGHGGGDLPEWMTHEGGWDMAAHDPVREFIRALALDEGYGTAERAREHEREHERPAERAAERHAERVPEWDDLDLELDWTLADDEPRDCTPDRDLYAKFEAKFDRSIAALWADSGAASPDDRYGELPVELLRDRLLPLHLGEAPPAAAARSLAAINHSRERSGFVEVVPRRRAAPPAPPPPPPARPPAVEHEDLLTSARTHFRPIERSAEEVPRYRDGDTFDISGDLEPVHFRRSESGGAYLGAGRYLEYRATPRRRAPHALPLRFPLRQLDAAAQTDGWGACDECASSAKKMRPDGGIWSEPRACEACAVPAAPAAPPPPDELARDWEELLADISAAHASLLAGGPPPPPPPPDDRKRRHSAALRCARHCAHPHARFLPCCALDRPLTR